MSSPPSFIGVACVPRTGGSRAAARCTAPFFLARDAMRQRGLF